MSEKIFGIHEIIILSIILIPLILLIIDNISKHKNELSLFTLETKEYTIEYTYASFTSRLIARLIDGLIMIIPNTIIPILPAWLYWSLQESGKNRTTIGKKYQKLYVMTVEGKRVSFGIASGRFLGMILNLCIFFIGLIPMFFNKRKQCLHDLLTGTIVVKEVKRTKRTSNTATLNLL